MQPPGEEPPPFFIVGSARSGTTLLRLMLNAHPDVAVPPESRFVVELYRGSEQVATRQFLSGLARHRQFSAWDLPIEAVRAEITARFDGDFPETAAYREVVTAAYRAYARVQGKSRWGDKTPRYVENISLISSLWPAARFVHLVRDGRNVALSYADVPFGPKSVTRAAALWAARVTKGIRTGRALPDGRYIEIRYEDIVEDTQGEAERLCEFLDLDFDPGMLDHTERARGAVLPRAARYNPNVTKQPMPQVRSWEEDMPADHVELFEAVAGNVLSELGYPRSHPAPGPRARFIAALGRAGVPLPRLKARR